MRQDGVLQSFQASISKSKSKEPNQHHKMRTAEFKSMELFCDMILQDRWSPMVFKDGYRSQPNFLSCDILAFDFDQDWRLENAQELVDKLDLFHVIGTTKSHTDELHKFRLIMFFQERIFDLQTYKYNHTKYYDAMPVRPDPQCKDGARFYHPCKEIISVGGSKLFKVDAYVAPPPQKIMYATNSVRNHMITSDIDRELSSASPGNRHGTILRVAFKLATRNFPLDFVIDYLRKSPVASVGENELIKTSTDAWRAGLAAKNK